MEIWELILQGKEYAYISPDGSNKIFPRKIRHKWASNIQYGEKTTRNPGGRNSNPAMAALKISRKHHPRGHQPYDLPTWGQIKTLINKA